MFFLLALHKIKARVYTKQCAVFLRDRRFKTNGWAPVLRVPCKKRTVRFVLFVSETTELIFSDFCHRLGGSLRDLSISVLVFWVVMPCGLVGRYQRLGGTHRLHLWG
jgi:hypothetical protein